jgi:hypothetical protein
MKKKGRFFICFSVIITVISLFSYFQFIKRTKGFCVEKIISKHPYHASWDVGPPTFEHMRLLNRLGNQTFRYLGSGKECYAFASEDEGIVIKFFKQKHMTSFSFIDFFPIPPPFKYKRLETLHRHHYLRQKTFTSYMIAYQKFREESGLLFLHLNPTSYINKRFTFITPQGKLFTLDMDKMEFLIQQKADHIFDRIDFLMKKGEIKPAQTVIKALLSHITTRSLRGIGDGDNNCKRNLGLVQNQPISIDIGEFYPAPAGYPQKGEYVMAMEDFQSWLDRKYPALGAFLRKELDDL